MSHPQDGLVVNLSIPHNQRTPLQAEEALGPISISIKSNEIWVLTYWIENEAKIDTEKLQF
jgi:hypothetical protein